MHQSSSHMAVKITGMMGLRTRMRLVQNWNRLQNFLEMLTRLACSLGDSKVRLKPCISCRKLGAARCSLRPHFTSLLLQHFIIQTSMELFRLSIWDTTLHCWFSSTRLMTAEAFVARATICSVFGFRLQTAHVDFIFEKEWIGGVATP
jgi:hypothetical protein